MDDRSRLRHLPWWLAALSLLAGCTSNDVCFSPDGACSELIVEELDAAGTSVHAAVYTFTDTTLRDRLLEASYRGVDVKLVMDPWSADSGNVVNQAVYDSLEDEGVPVRWAPNPSGGIMHHKFAVIDGRMVLTGSYNWTESADTLNDENLMRITDEQLAGRFESAFEELWARSE